MSALTGGRELAFSSFALTKEEKARKRRKTTRGGISTSSRKPLNLGLQVFALRRRLRSSSPHRATARWEPCPPLDSPLNRPEGVATPPLDSPGERPNENLYVQPPTSAHTPYHRIPVSSNSRKLIVLRRTGRIGAPSGCCSMGKGGANLASEPEHLQGEPSPVPRRRRRPLRRLTGDLWKYDGPAARAVFRG